MKQKKTNTWILIILFLSSLCVAGSFTASNLMKKDVHTFAKNSSDLENVIMKVIDIPTVGLELKERNEVTKIKNAIRSDSKMQTILQKLTPIFIKDLVLGTKSDVEFVKSDVLDLVKTYENHLVKYTSGSTAEDKKMNLRNTINMWNIDADYQKQLLFVKAYMPFPFMLLLMSIFIFSSMITKVISMILLLGSVAYYIWMEKGNDCWSKRLGKPFLYSGIITAVLTFVFKAIYSAMPYKYVRYFGALQNSNFYILGIFVFIYIMIGSGCILYSSHKNTENSVIKEK